MILKKLLYSLGLASMTMLQSYATPYIPSNGAEVLEHLPSRNDPAQQELRRLRAELAIHPENLPVAVDLVRLYITTWRDGGDPRYLGYAQAALAPWWNLPDPPLAARVMRATLLQSTHRFTAALADLDAVLRSDRNNAQAWLTRATVLTVLGEYAEAKKSCLQLSTLAPALVTRTCLSSVENLNGQAEKSYRELRQAFMTHPDADPGIKLWILTLLAEMSLRLADTGAAQSYFQQALALGNPDNYLLAAYADFLLGRHQPAQVVSLLKGKSQVDALLLRYALALDALNAPDADKVIAQLQQRFEAAKMRGDTIHQREQARFELELMHNPRAALKLAQENWSIQKEPADTLLLLNAAAAAGDRHAAQPVLAWIQKTGFEDRALAAPIAQLGSK